MTNSGRLGRRLLRRVVRIVPSRSETGRGTTRHVPSVDGGEWRATERDLERGNVAAADRSSADLYERHPDIPRVLALRAKVLGRLGDLEEEARVLHRLHALDDRAETRAWERRVLGRLIVSRPGWLPPVGTSVEPPDPAERVVLFLAAESAPHRSSVVTEALASRVRAARQEGLQPVVVTALGFPRRVGRQSVQRIEIVDEVQHHRLDLGQFYRLDAPIDIVLSDGAWLTARVARAVRPALLHVVAGEGTIAEALVALALRELLARPLVYDVVASSANDRRPIGEVDRRRLEAERFALARADHVLTGSAAARDSLIERGLDGGRVGIIAESGANGTRGSEGRALRVAYERAQASRFAAVPAGA
ncbi:MAG: glycosyltransferase [Chloroflexota bacterium]